MSKLNLKEKLTQYIIDADDSALHYLNEATIKYDERQRALDKMIEEGEEDIRKGDVYTTEEVFKELLKKF